MSAAADIRRLRLATESWVTAAVPVSVESSAGKVSRDGKPYHEVVVADALDRFTLRVWSDHPQYASACALAAGDCLRLEGEFHVHPTFGLEARRWQMTPLEPEERATFLAGPPELRAKQEADYQLLAARAERVADPRLQALASAYLEKFGPRLRRTAAARTYHHARRGGLVEHTAQMARYAEAICTANPALHADLLFCGVLFHDCGKLWENCLAEDGFAMPYDERGELIGHITIGIELVNNLWRTLPLADWSALEPASEDVRLHLLHLVASHHGELAFGSPVEPKTPEAIALHYIDNLDAKLEMLDRGYQTSALVGPRIHDKVRPLNIRPVTPLAVCRLPAAGEDDGAEPAG